MAHNSRGDRFAQGTSEGAQVHLVPVSVLKRLPSGDAPGKTVGAILDAKRNSRGHRAQVLEMKRLRLQGLPVIGNVDPLTVKGGALVDGHHRVASAEDAGLPHLPVRLSPA